MNRVYRAHYLVRSLHGYYLSPEGEWLCDAAAAAAYEDVREAADAADAEVQRGYLGAHVVSCGTDDRPPAEAPQWDQARSCWRGESGQSEAIAAIVDGAIGTTPHAR